MPKPVVLITALALALFGCSTAKAPTSVATRGPDHPPSTTVPAPPSEDVALVVDTMRWDDGLRWHLAVRWNDRVHWDQTVAAARQEAARPVQRQAQDPTPRRIESGGPSPPSGSGVWDRLAQCESSGNWAYSAGPFYGGLQFLPSTWRAYGGTGMPYDHPRETQIAVAERVLAAAGGRFTDWPGCRARLGLP